MGDTGVNHISQICFPHSSLSPSLFVDVQKAKRYCLTLSEIKYSNSPKIARRKCRELDHEFYYEFSRIHFR